MGSELRAAATDDIAEEAGSYGASHVYTAPAPTGRAYCPEWYVAFIEEACKRCDPASIIFGHSPLGQDIAPRLAARLQAGLVTDCVGISVDGQDLAATKPVQGGVALATFSFNARPQIVTVRRGVESAPAIGASHASEIIEIEVPSDADAQWELVEHVLEESSEINLEDAEIVVSGGRGIGGPDGFDLLRELATALGAAVGSSRPPCDADWISPSHQVGITGKTVSPQVYMAVGISGASQRLCGMGDSKTIIAINKDAEADIFRVADYGVVSDYRKIMPALIDAIKELGS